MSALAGLWLAVKGFAGPLMRALLDPRVIMALIAAGALWGVYGAGRHAGRLEAEAGHKEALLQEQASQLAQDEATFQKIDGRLAAMAKAWADRTKSEAARAGALNDFISEMGKHAPDARCLFTPDDVRLLDKLDRATAGQRGGTAAGGVPDH